MAPMRRTAPSKGSRCSGLQVARTEAQEALHDLQVVLHAMIDLAQQHLSLRGSLALLVERFLGRRQQPRVEIAEGTRGGQPFLADAALGIIVCTMKMIRMQARIETERARRDMVAQTDRVDMRSIWRRSSDRHDGDPSGQGRAREGRSYMRLRLARGVLDRCPDSPCRPTACL